MENSLIGNRALARQRDTYGPATLGQVMDEMEAQAASGEAERLHPMATGFTPLDDILNGGLRPGELLVIGGPFGVGKTIWGLQVARNAVCAGPRNAAIYICYEHDRTHLLSRLLCLETAERGLRDDALTLRKITELMLAAQDGTGFVSKLRRNTRYAAVLNAMEAYAGRLFLVRASGDHTTLDGIREWTEEVLATGVERLVVVVDYLQKIPVARAALEPETEVTTHLTQGLKEMAMALGVQVVAIAAADRSGLQVQAHAAGRPARQLGITVRGRHRPDPEQQVRHPQPRARGLQPGGGRKHARLGGDERGEKPGGPERRRHAVPARCRPFPHRAPG